MNDINFLLQIFKGIWAIKPEVAIAYQPNLNRVVNGEPFSDITKDQKLKPTLSIFTDDMPMPGCMPGQEGKDEGDIEDGGAVGVISLRDVMMRYGSWCTSGTEDVAELLQQVETDSRFAGSILRIDSPGGTTSSLLPLMEVLKNKQKTCIAFVDDQAASAAYYAACNTDEIWCSSPMAEVGSIGVMAILQNTSEAEKMAGVQIIRVIPKESQFKQKNYLDAIGGNTENLANEELSPWAIHFQDVVKAKRPNLNQQVEGILEGKTFYATQALSYGLVDKIGNLNDCVKRVIEKYRSQKQKQEVNQLISLL